MNTETVWLAKVKHNDGYAEDGFLGIYNTKEKAVDYIVSWLSDFDTDNVGVAVEIQEYENTGVPCVNLTINFDYLSRFTFFVEEIVVE